MRVLIVVVLLALAGSAQAAYKCTGPDGKVQYIETPCPAGTSGGEVRIQPNSLDTSGARSQAATPPEQRQPQAGALPAAAAVCPTSLDIRNLETSAASVTIGRAEQAFLREEVRRARACATAGGNYTADDWRRIREGQSAQLSVSPQRRRQERRTVEDIHASASPAERDRIQSERNAALARGPNAVAECDGSGCWDLDGLRYNRVAGGNQFVREDGAQCRSVDNRMRCN